MPEAWKSAVENLATQVTKSNEANEKLADTVHNYIQGHSKEHTKLEVKVAENRLKTSHLVLLAGGVPGLTGAIILLAKYLPA